MLRFVSLFFLVLLVAAGTLSAQTKKLDSLQTLLKTAKDDTAKVHLLNRIAEERIGEPANARATAQEALSLAIQIGDKSAAAQAMNTIAFSHIDQGSYPEAIRESEQALALAKTANDKLNQATAYGNMGTAQWREGNNDTALELCFKALPLQEEIGDKKGMAASLQRIGTVYEDIGNTRSAEEYYRKSLALAESIGDMRRIGNLLNTIGNGYDDRKQYDTALAYFRRAFAINERIQYKRYMAINLYNIGATQVNLKRFDEAQTTLEQALRLSKELGLKNNISYVLGTFVDLYAAQSKFTEAIRYGTQALTLADSLGARPPKRNALKALSETYLAKGDTGKAFVFYKSYIALRDSLTSEENIKKATLLENKYAADKKDKEILLLKKDVENQALVRNSMAGGLALVGALVGVLIFSNNRRKKANTLLHSQAAKIQLANTQLQEKNIVITEAHTETQRLLTNVNDSIRYAKRIQDAMLPSTETLNRLLPEHFIFFRPKDVVSGDFYWCKEVQGKVFVAAVDCTGHGVPGAFMSLIGNALLNDIVQRLPEPHPDLILNELHHELQTVLRQRETNNDDGMDMCLCMIDLQARRVEFAGAMNPLYAVVAGELREFKGTPEELGGREERSPVYERYGLDLSAVPKGSSMLYLTSDGYKDQYNEAKQRFMPKRLRPLLAEIAAKLLEEQPTLLGAAIDAHKGEMFQVDDMLVLGVRL